MKHDVFENFIFEIANKFDAYLMKFEGWTVQKHVNLIDLVKSFLSSIYYLLANISFDTFENEPPKG